MKTMDTDKLRFSFQWSPRSVEDVASGEYIGDNIKCADGRGSELIFTITGRDEVKVTKCEGVASDGCVTIPSKIPFLFRHGEDEIRLSFKVVSIGEEAFYVCRSLKEISIPDTVTTIGYRSFCFCTSLAKIVIPASVTSIKSNVFYGCTSLKEITVDGDNPVYDSCDNCNAIIEKTSGCLIQGCAATVIPSSVTSIWDRAFDGCTSLAKIVIPASVTSIKSNVFYGCTSLKEITVDGDNPVYDSRDNCNAIIETATGRLIQGCAATVIPDSVASIGDSAFSGCRALKEIRIPASVENIGNWAFSDCGIEKISFADTMDSVIEQDIDGYTYFSCISIPCRITSIGQFAFSGCTSLKEISIPASVTEIGEIAFDGCTSLAKIVIPASVTSIKSNVFSGCTSLKEITVDGNNPVYDSRENCNAIIETASGRLVRGCAATVIPSSVTSIGDWAFKDCTSLAKIVIPTSVTSIGEGAFSRCTSLKEITVDGNNPVYDSRENCNAIIETASGCLIQGCAATVIPSSVTSIWDLAFDGCTSLAKIGIPASVIYIGYRAFAGCTSLKEIVIPDSVTEIGGWAFSDCTSLAGIVIPDSITSIGARAFDGCTSLTEIYCLTTTPPEVRGFDLGLDKGDVTVYVPRKSVGLYRSADGWKECVIKPMPE